MVLCAAPMESPLVDVGAPLLTPGGSRKQKARRRKKGDRRQQLSPGTGEAAPPPSEPDEPEDDIESDLERIIGHTFDARRLRRELNSSNLDGVREARLCIKEGDDAGALGELLPSLRSLVLDGSHLSSLRDLGTRLQDLTRLSIKKCGLTDLDGLNAFPSLQELDISDNTELIDISDLFHHDTLSVLRARRTALHELTCLEVLGTCAELREVELSDTPLATAFDTKTFETLVRHHAGHVRRLNGSPLDAKHVELDDDALEAAAQALEPVHESSKDSDWETVPGTRGNRRVNSNNVVVVMHSESDSELTKTEDRTFAGAPLAIFRRAKKVGEVTTSVCSTLDVARKLDGDLRGSAESDQLLEEWRRDAELHKDSSDDAVRTAAIQKKKRRPILTPVPATPPSSQKKSPVPSPMFSRRQAEQQLGFAPRPQTRRGPRGRKDSCKAPQQAWAARTASPSSDSDECLDRAEIKRRARRTPCSTKKRRPFASPEELVLVDTPSSEAAASPARAVDAVSPALAPVASPALGPRGGARRRRRARVGARGAGAPTAAVAAAAASAAAAAPADPREGAANRLADADVVALLAQPPKHVRHLRTRDGFRRFFTGVPRARMAQLLTEAFAGQPPEEAAARREKRLALLADVLAD